MPFRRVAAALAAAILLPAMAQGAGFAHSEHFIVFAPDLDLAKTVAANAEQYRTEIAAEWFGEAMKKGTARAIIQVSLSADYNSGVTAHADHPERDYQQVWIDGPREYVLGPLLRHELVHVLCASRFAGSPLPIWLEEGIAASYDHPASVARRRHAMAQGAASGDLPRASQIVALCGSHPIGAENYRAAASLAEHLFELGGGDRTRFLAFAVETRDLGAAKALARSYGLRSLGDLQQSWEAWCRDRARETEQVRAESVEQPVEPAPQRAPAAVTSPRAALPAMTVLTR